MSHNCEKCQNNEFLSHNCDFINRNSDFLTILAIASLYLTITVFLLWGKRASIEKYPYFKRHKYFSLPASIWPVRKP